MRVFVGSTVKTAFDLKPVEKTLGVPAETPKKKKLHQQGRPIHHQGADCMDH